MSFIISPEVLPQITLSRDITKHLKRGHRWVFANGFDPKLKPASGLQSLSYKGELLGFGVVQSDTQLRFRMFCQCDEPFFRKNQVAKTLDVWFQRQWKNALAIRKSFNTEHTNSFRLINGEGDGFPGLVIDIYQDVAVMKHDHPIMEKVWNRQTIAEQIIKDFPKIKTVYLKRRNDDDEKGLNLIGEYQKKRSLKKMDLSLRPIFAMVPKLDFSWINVIIDF